MHIENRFLSETPNAERIPPPPNLGLVAEDVVEGLRIALATINKNQPASLSGPENMARINALEAATTVLLRFLEDIPKIEDVPVFEVVGQDIQTYRLGRLLNDEYALFNGPARLTAGSRYRINYWNRHRVPDASSARDVLPGLMYENQLYMGYAPPRITDMDGYAISLNYFLKLNTENIINLSTVKMEELEAPSSP